MLISPDKLYKATLAAMLIVVAGFGVVTPLSGDQRVSVAAAHLAYLNGGGIANISEQWNLRGIGHKCWTYACYTFAKKCRGFPPTRSFEIIYTIFALSIYWILLFIGARACSAFLQKWGLTSFEVFYVCACSFTLCSWWIVHQPEYLAALISTVALGFLLAQSPMVVWISGMLSASTVLAKGITLLSGLSVLPLAIAIDKSSRAKRLSGFLLGLLLAGPILVFGYLFVWVDEIPDLLNATMFQSSEQASVFGRIRSVAVTLVFTAWVHVPVLIPGGVGVVGLVIFLWKRNELRSLLSLLLAIALVLIAPLAQAKYFAYHYALLLPITIVGVLSLIVVLRRHNLYWAKTFMIACPPVGLAILMLPPLNPLQREPQSVLTAIRASNQTFEAYSRLRNDMGIETGDSLLYLDDGGSTYFLGVRSHLQYFYPLPLQRSGGRLKASQLRKDQLQDALEFKGNAVVVNADWFDLSRTDAQSLLKFMTTPWQPIGGAEAGLRSISGSKIFQGGRVEVYQRRK